MDTPAINERLFLLSFRFVQPSSENRQSRTDYKLMSWVQSPGQTLVTGNVWGKSCTGGITLKNVLDLSVLHSFLTRFNRKTLFHKLNHYIKLHNLCYDPPLQSEIIFFFCWNILSGTPLRVLRSCEWSTDSPNNSLNGYEHFQERFKRNM